MTLPNFDELIEKYAATILRAGINQQPGETTIIQADIDQAPLVRALSAQAWALGARDVIVRWGDAEIGKSRLENASDEVLGTTGYAAAAFDDFCEEVNPNLIFVKSSGPSELAGVDIEKIKISNRTAEAAQPKRRKLTGAGKMPWIIVGAASENWAHDVFPDLPVSEAVDKLWEAIFFTSRVSFGDPLKNWEDHAYKLGKTADLLTSYQFDHILYRAEGTDLKIGLGGDRIWISAGGMSGASKKEYIPNIPTEEIFTTPDFHRVDGVVRATKPLNYSGNLVDDFELTFKDGRVVDYKARVGQEVLASIIEADEGAHFLGELALVPIDTPINESGLLFLMTLFDENASNHLAVGRGYPAGVIAGPDMNDEELREAGVNYSSMHVDFMVGSDKTDIDGVTADGEVVPIFRNGKWTDEIANQL
ncbi:MAG: aminopeptidase [Lactobacillales bacterium]|jgi:aminopeptidase|nr:aminopeptidase [Lactobacillales bacterium]